jgi:CBS domain-containing protein
MKVADVMTRGVVSVAPDDAMRKAALLMLQYDVSGFPVLDRGKLVGMVTEGDFLSRVETGTERRQTRGIEFLTDPGRLAAEYAHSHGRNVGDVMSTDVVTVSEDASIEDAVRLMERHHIKRLPVVRGGAMVGILTRADILHAFIVGSPKPQAASVSDGAIREQLMAELGQQTWVPHRSVNVVVENGAVEFQGVVRDERQRTALRTLAENIPGVKAVSDNLRILDPGAIK